MMRTYHYINEIKENEINSKLEAVQVNGIWDCTLCGNCNMVCPSNIEIKGDI
jgi:succinate dehydrogenase/fumarate reductase-like Fe-S protein